jgi:hypothetical protein
LVTLAVAVVALLLAFVSSVVAWRAASRAGDAVDRVAALEKAKAVAPQPESTTTPPVADQPANQPTDEPTDEPAEQPTGAVPTLDAQTQYKTRYTGQPLKIAAGCGQTVYLDLDEPRVQVDTSIAEFNYYDGCGGEPAHFRMQSGIDGSQVPSTSVTPVECAEQIRANPLLHNANIPVHRGDVFCVTTSLDNARAAGISWKMVMLTILATAQDGTVSLKANAWDIPS